MSASPPLLLLRRSLLQPGESFPSLMARLTDLNHYSPGLMFWLCFRGDGAGQRRISLDKADPPVKATTYERLAIVTGLPSADLYAATIHRYALLTDEIPWDDLTGVGNLRRILSRHNREFRTSRRAQFCSACLNEAAYHRRIWMPIALAACLHHRRLLVSRCPQCERSVSVAMIVKTHCQACGANLTECPSQTLGDDEFGLFSQQVLQAWLEGPSLPECAWTASMPGHPPAVLYRLIKRLRYTMLCYLNRERLAPAAKEKAALRSIEEAPWVQYELNRLAVKAIVNWPEGFMEFTARWRAGALFGDSSLGQYAVVPSQKRFYLSLLFKYWRSPEFGFVRELLPRIDPCRPGKRVCR